ncbi:helix-turn-helix domain-containing protein [Marixanthomonas spongiae]|jgi:transcriptional regulator with XRE-family HTH domain|uniref:DNA-binding protein n=1 Tax=Marixanthomonas spongiae TaxID=2174845 RepID=A0A2U0HT21_9FLAO|nr:helix-turn-helix transcriptional regulator [Marixanthomonas spongiae]PVW11988.1 DNA-binding protein [Marixanthomonas spongiae]|tara:strand:- start:3091 stop:3318 length:228 start_codon:yes stop_codon:yes gene_type:complete
MDSADKIFLQSIGKNISKIRRQKKMTQIDVCAIIDMDVPNLSSIENGRQNVTSLTLKKIAGALDVAVVDFFQNSK